MQQCWVGTPAGGVYLVHSGWRGRCRCLGPSGKHVSRREPSEPERRPDVKVAVCYDEALTPKTAMWRKCRL